MMKLTHLACVAAMLLAAAALADDKMHGDKHAGMKEKKAATNPQTKCPVMGGKIDKKVYADHDGKRVYFCCPGCIAKFEADPEKYIKSLEAKGVTVETVGKAQEECPVTGGKVSKKVHADHDGKRVYFCCPGCIAKFEADPEKYLKKLASAGVVLEKVPSAKTEAQVTWTCAMHPQVKTAKPGKCPICAMALIPRKTGNNDHEHGTHKH